jgi:phosphatidate cytidylyltransferase
MRVGRDAAVRWGDLRKRVLSAALLAPTALACIWLGADAWTGLMALAAGGLAYEWVVLCNERPWRVPGAIVPVAVLLAGLVAVLDRERWAIVVLGLGAVLAWLLGGRRALGAGVLYVGLASVALIWLRGDGAAGRANVLFLVVVVWASDIGAYVAGRLLGGPKLAPAISPGKTWAGAAGGLLAAMLVGEAAGHALGAAAQSVGAAAPGRAALVAGLLGVAAQCGDLLESAIKRRFGVKDSGRLIPGHGGLLDRLDGLLTAAPAAAGLALWLGQGVALWQ